MLLLSINLYLDYTGVLLNGIYLKLSKLLTVLVCFIISYNIQTTVVICKTTNKDILNFLRSHFIPKSK